MAELWDVLDENGVRTGRVCERGPMKPGDYHLVVHVWIMNSKGEFLISKRTPNKTFPGMWECTGGSAISGDDSLTTALKETREELGITLVPKNGQLFKTFQRDSIGSGDFADVWLFRQEADISGITLQPDETCDAMWADREKINRMIGEGSFIGRDIFPYLDELFYFCDKPFWEIGYRDKNASTFAKGPTNDIASFYQNLKPNSFILDAGCGEGRNSIFLAGHGHRVDAFDLSEAGIEKARSIAAARGLDINFFVRDLADFTFERDYDVIMSHGVLHLPEKHNRDAFLAEAQKHTKPGGYNIIGVFTNRLPATPDNAPFTKSLFDVGELPAKYSGWKLIAHDEGTLRDSHPGGVSHEHAHERIIAQKQYDSAFCDNAFWTALDTLVAESKIVIDRPRGSKHPKYPGFVYPVDYGYLENTRSMDGGGIDLWRGTGNNAIDAIICTVDLLKKDSEIKILIGCDEEEKRLILSAHNDSEYMKGIMVRR